MTLALNTFGLLQNIAGVVLLFFYGPPQPSFEEIEGWGPYLRNTEQRDKSRALRKRYQRYSRLALALILIGFIIQLAAVWWPALFLRPA